MIEGVLNYINTVSGGNQMVAGAVTLAFSGLAAWLLKEMPRKVMSFIKHQLVTTLTFNNTDWNKSQTFIKMSEFLHKLTTERGSRTLILDSGWVDGKDIMVLTMGYGKHFFFYKGRFMWLNRAKLDSSGSERMKEEIQLSVLGRKHKIFKDLVDENKPKDDMDVINFSEFNGDRWVVKSKIRKQGLDSLALNKDTKELFTSELDYFINHEDTYRKLGLPYKMSWILHGIPGSGKSSIIRAIASDYSMNICNLPLNLISDKGFKEAILGVPENSIVVIEDFDSCSAVNKRANVSGDDKRDKDKSYKDMADSFLTLSGILNTLDGVASLENVIIIFTTNCIESIDSALLRPGRMDKIVELPMITGGEVKKHFERLYGGEVNFPCRPMLAKEINSIIFEAKGDFDKAKSLLKEK